MKNINLKSSIPYVGAIILFFIISSLFFSPAYEGYWLKTHDMSSNSGMSKEVEDYRLLYEDEPFWSSTMFGGMPSYTFSVIYSKVDILKPIKDALTLWLPYPISVLFLYFMGFFILLLALRINIWYSLFGAIGFGLSTYSIIILPAGHVTKAFAIAYMPAVLGAFIMLYRGKSWLLSFSLLSLFLALEIGSSHPQITYYLGFIILFVALGELIKAIKEKNTSTFIKRSSLAILALVLALGANFVNLYNTYEYGKQTIRGENVLSEDNSKGENSEHKELDYNKSKGLDRDYIVAWALDKQELSSIFMADAKGGVSAAIKSLPHMDKKLKGNTSPQYYNTIGQSFSSYWGNQPMTSGPPYIGAIIFFLAVMGAYFVRGYLKWSLVSVSALAILLSLGDHFGGSIRDMWLTNFFIDYVPLYSKFRAVAMILVIIQVTAAFLAVLFIQDVVKNKDSYKTRLKELLIVAGAIIFVWFIFYMPASSWYDFLSIREQGMLKPEYKPVFNALEEFRKNVLSSEVKRNLGLVVLSVIAIVWFLKSSNNKTTRNFTILGISLLILVIVDMWNVDRRYVDIVKTNSTNPNNKYSGWELKSSARVPVSETNADKAIFKLESANSPLYEPMYNTLMEKYSEEHENKAKPKFVQQQDIQNLKYSAINFTSNYRVLNLNNPFNDSFVSFFHKSVGGYSAAKLRRYQDLIERQLTQDINKLSSVKDLKETQILNMLNTKYIITNSQNNPIYNPHAFGNAWFIDSIKIADSNLNEIESLGGVNLKKYAIVNSEFKNNLESTYYKKDSLSTIDLDLKNYKPTLITYNSSNKNQGFAVFSEIYYKDGWNAYIDGKKADYLRANYVLRALSIPAGDHKIEFKFEPASIKTYNLITTFSKILLITLLLLGVFITIKKML